VTALKTAVFLQDACRTLHHRKNIFFLAFISALLTAAVVTELQTPVFESHTIVKIDPRPAIPGLPEDRPYDIRVLMNTEVKSLKSLEVSRRAAALLGWIPPEMDTSESYRLAGILQDRIQTEQLGESNLIQVSVRDDDAERAAALANAVVKAYIDRSVEDNNKHSREAREFTEAELKKAEIKMNEAEETLKTYSRQTGARGTGSLLAEERINLQAHLDVLTKTYTDRHPDVSATRAKIVALDKQLRELPAEEIEYQRLAREVRVNEDNYTFLSRKFKEAQIAEADRKQLAFLDSPALVPENPIRPRFQTNMAIGAAAGLMLGLLIVFLLETLDTSLGTIEEVERFVDLPVLAVIPHIRTEGGISFLGFGRSESPIDDMRRRLVIFQPTQSSFAEAYHTLRTNVRLPLRPGGRPAPIVAFTSATASEGKTLTAVNFALTSAQSGLKTLFIEADLRRPFAHMLLGMKREPGLVDAVIGGADWKTMVRGTSDFLFGELNVESLLMTPGIENFRLLPAGQAPVNPADVLGSPRFDDVLRESHANFDLVVVDCAPVMTFADALILGPRTDGVLLVHKAGRTARGALKRAKDQLLNVKTKVLGIVLNDLRASEMQPRYGYSYPTEDYKSSPRQ
jgi:tyrosine-protein kinase Etk/Wzc